MRRSEPDRGWIWCVALAVLFTLIFGWSSCCRGECPNGQCQVPGYSTPTYQPYRPVPVQSQDASPEIVDIRNAVGGGLAHAGTGTIIESGDGKALVLTVFHLLDPGNGTITVTCGGRKYPATIVGHDRDADLLLLQIADPGVRPRPVASDTPGQAVSVTGAGFGGGDGYRAFSGPILGYRQYARDGARDILVVGAAVRQGDSGGPVIDQSGYLVAVIQRCDGQQTYGACCRRINDFLRRFRQRPQPTPGSKPTPAPTVPPPSLPPSPNFPTCPGGPKGDKGDPGPAGPAGKDGRDGKDASVDVSAINAKIAALQAQLDALAEKPIGIRTLNLDGSTHQEAHARLGDLVILKPLAVKAEAK